MICGISPFHLWQEYAPLSFVLSLVTWPFFSQWNDLINNIPKEKSKGINSHQLPCSSCVFSLFSPVSRMRRRFWKPRVIIFSPQHLTWTWNKQMRFEVCWLLSTLNTFGFFIPSIYLLVLFKTHAQWRRMCPLCQTHFMLGSQWHVSIVHWKAPVKSRDFLLGHRCLLEGIPTWAKADSAGLILVYAFEFLCLDKIIYDG